jgi:hypothetical protein
VRAIEEQAEQVLARVPGYVWDGEGLPIPIEDIVDSVFGLHVRDVEDLTTAPDAPELAPGQFLSGLLLAARGEIWVNADEARQWPPRRRFTIGHELGHWVMHRTGQQTLFCRHTAVDEEVSAEPPAVDIEEEASVFAASLLMPAWLVIREHARVRGDIDELCETFDASRAAMDRRIADLFGRDA